MKTVTLNSSLVRFHWLTGDVDEHVGIGDSACAIAADAANKLGYGGGAMRALDYWELIEEAVNEANS